MNDYVDPSQPDPRFPNRPTHADFVRLSNAVQANDARADNGEGLEQIVGVDSASLYYLIRSRLGFLQLPEDSRLMALYADAFALGKTYAENP